MKIALILGTRPEIIKLAPIIKELERRNIDHFVLHTGQHYSYEMDRKFFEDLELREVKYNLEAGSNEYRKQLGLMIRQIMEILRDEQPDIAIVQGDTNSVLAGAQAANKLGIKIGHHEAGLRSHDLTMLEETNRIITDHISEYLFAPTEDAVKNLLDEGISKYKIHHVGNTVVDALLQNLEISNKKLDILSSHNLEKKNYILVTAHRAENVDAYKRLEGILKGLELVAEHFGLPVIFPIHHRTKMSMEKHNLPAPKGVRLIEPAGYLEFLQLEARAKLIITDSGGVQEEACILKVPCVTVRDNTERPETVIAGMNMLAGVVPEKILECAKQMVEGDRAWTNPFGDGKAGEKIADVLEKLFG
ncbi:UDP-N-acetylglucosamine 2-epimerase (non-hydrolyzing) [Candidatus Falkowbacteria bacterium CG11_big_fil_rev_8_21_14_0_20_39_10]|uniref:UDP-N-acetylglucosamine 2-epimerase (Non-hydrolyzing) n=1 Tax=Candidatus Falkowbacteria bacterium CG11_big_fil_rev_8_21_14_0_20_39_10 TaxID=1974570 RepID=A0A2M6K8E7_9BACT|nr:MAG: UDP-N-acetylglucosamine 2-epimerase (non-hydrolyzing) [Candidatus Falkowbacteria bacterium CG11_big_fil_rev_8_21_14_0_20_39_10]